MMDTMWLVIGSIAGLVGGVAIVFFLPYRSLRHVLVRTQTDLAEERAKSNDLQSAVIHQQSAIYQARQTMLTQQKRYEGELVQASERCSKLEQQCLEWKNRSEQNQKQYLQEVAQLRESVAHTEQEKTASQKHLAQERVEWDRQIQSLLLQSAQMEDQLQSLRRDKTTLSMRLEQQQEAWEGERLEMQVQINTLEDGLTLTKARANQNLSPDSAQLMEQLKAEATEELTRQRAIWEEERKSLQNQLERWKTESRPSSWEAGEQHPFLQPESWEREKEGLLQQLEQAHQLRRHLEEKMAEQDRRAEQERSALEAEIEQLMERFLRMYNEQGGQ